MDVSEVEGGVNAGGRHRSSMHQTSSSDPQPVFFEYQSCATLAVGINVLETCSVFVYFIAIYKETI